MVAPLRRGETPHVAALGVELEKIGLASCRGVLMDAPTIEAVEAACEHWPPQVMSVRRRWADTAAASLLRDGDLVLEANGRHLETFRDVELALAGGEAGSEAGGGPAPVSLRVVRGGKEMCIEVAPKPLDDVITDRLVMWAGATLQRSPAAVAAQRGQHRTGVYVASRFHGSPETKFGLPPTSRIVSIDGVDTPDLDAFLRAVAAKKHGDTCRVKHLDLRGAPSVTTLRLDTQYWPLSERRRVEGPRAPDSVEPYHWQRSDVAVGAGGALEFSVQEI